MHFSLIGWIIIIASVTLSMFGGMFLGRYVNNVETFLIGGRQVRKFLLTTTGQATEVGIVAVMMMAQEAYVHGPVALSFTIVTMVAGLLTGLSGFCVYRLRQTEAITLGHYAQMRYGSKGFRIFTGIPLIIAGVATIAMFPAALGMFLTYFMGLPEQVNLLGFMIRTPSLISAIFVFVIIVYTLLAGSPGVIFADFFQFAMIWVGLIMIALYIAKGSSWSGIVNTFDKIHGPDGFSTVKSSNYGIGWISFMFIQCLFGAIVWPPAVSRILSCKTPKVSNQMYLLTSLIQPGRIAVVTLAGLAAATVITTAQLPAANKVLLGAPSLAAMPIFISTLLPPLVLAVFFAAMMCAEISNTDGYILAWSGIATHDVIMPFITARISEKQQVNINRLFVIAIGIAVFLWGIFFTLSETLLTYIMLSGATYTSGAAAFLVCGLYWKRANKVGAWAGMSMGMLLPLTSMVMTGFVGVQFIPMKWVGILSYVLAFGGMILGSLIGERITSVYTIAVVTSQPKDIGKQLKAEMEI